MKKLILLSILHLFLFSCSSDKEDDFSIKHEFSIYNDDIDPEITNVTISCKDVISGKSIDQFVIDKINYNSKSRTISTIGNNITVSYEYIVNGIKKTGTRDNLYFLGSNAKTISTSGLSDNLGSSSSAGGGSNQTSSYCGARTKDGGTCKRKVKGGGRCWQHK